MAVRDAITIDWSGLEVLPIDECEALLREHHVGRVGFVDAGSPVVLPVNYALDGHAVVFRTGRGSKLANATMRRPVCFEIDAYDPTEHTGWSVLVKGIAEEEIGPVEIARLDGLPVRPWTRPDLRHCWVRILAEEISGRRIRKAAVTGDPTSGD